MSVPNKNKEFEEELQSNVTVCLFTGFITILLLFLGEFAFEITPKFKKHLLEFEVFVLITTITCYILLKKKKN